MEIINQVFLSIPSLKIQILDLSNIQNLSQFQNMISERFSIFDYTLYYQNRLLKDISLLKNLSTIYLHLSLKGGKGGFGSLLKAQACNIKATNTDASRDLEGRRMRNINNHQNLKDFFINKKKLEDNLKIQQDIAKQHQKKQREDESYFKVQKDFIEKQEKWSQSLKNSIRKGKIPKVPQFQQKNDEKNEEKNEENIIQKKVKLNDNIENDIYQQSFQQFNNQIDQIEQIQQQKFDNEIEQKELQMIQEQFIEKEDQLLNFDQIDNIEDLLKLGSDKLKLYLTKLGMKCGGSLNERAQRLIDVKNDPNCLLNPKYLAKVK